MTRYVEQVGSGRLVRTNSQHAVHVGVARDRNTIMGKRSSRGVKRQPRGAADGAGGQFAPDTRGATRVPTAAPNSQSAPAAPVSPVGVSTFVDKRGFATSELAKKPVNRQQESNIQVTAMSDVVFREQLQFADDAKLAHWEGVLSTAIANAVKWRDTVTTDLATNAEQIAEVTDRVRELRALSRLDAASAELEKRTAEAAKRAANIKREVTVEEIDGDFVMFRLDGDVGGIFRQLFPPDSTDAKEAVLVTQDASHVHDRDPFYVIDIEHRELMLSVTLDRPEPKFEMSVADAETGYTTPLRLLAERILSGAWDNKLEFAVWDDGSSEWIPVDFKDWYEWHL